MKIKTSEIIDNALDWAVSVAKGIPTEELYISGKSLFRRLRDEEGNLNGRYMTGPDLLFSRKWEAGGPIIEREWISLDYESAFMGEWKAVDKDGVAQIGPTPLIAAMRCYVASKLGDEVDVPEELL